MGAKVGASFFVTAEAYMNFNIGHKTTSEHSSTKSVAKSIKFTMPSQRVKCPPHKRIELTWNFFLYTETV